MYNNGGSKQILRFITIGIIVVFSMSVLTFYWIIATSPITISIGNLPEENFQPLLQKFVSENLSKFSKSSQNSENHHHSTANFNKLKSVTVSSSEGKLSSELKFSDYNAEFQSSSYSSTKSKLKETEEEMDMRVNRVTKMCRKYHLGNYKWPNNGTNSLNEKEPPTPLYSYFFWNRQRHLAWCPVYKAGSTSWLYNMMILAGFSESELENSTKQFSTMAREVYGDAEPDPEALEQSLKLLIVRHPFERLVSAYRDKLSNVSIGHEHGTVHFYKKYGQKIVKKYRKKGKSGLKLNQVEPTWEEFVEYLISTELINYSDDHWLPAYYSCTPCLVSYDIIAKVETYSRDQEYIIYKAGLEGLIKPQWNHKSSSKSHPEIISSSSSQISQHEYFSKLSRATIENLYKKYWFDFELFGYDYKEYLKFAKDY